MAAGFFDPVFLVKNKLASQTECFGRVYVHKLDELRCNQNLKPADYTSGITSGAASHCSGPRRYTRVFITGAKTKHSRRRETQSG